MKIPLTPPSLGALLDDTSGVFVTAFDRVNAVDEKGRYLHWDKLRHLPAPEGLTNQQWWLLTRVARQKLSQTLDFYDKAGNAFSYASPDLVQRELHWLDRYAAGTVQTASMESADSVTNLQMRESYLIRSLIEEAINSSQLEGAATTRNVAKDMIREDREPRNTSEQMILNNYHAMQFIREVRDEDLTPSIVFELQRILTEDTLDVSSVGRFRKSSDNIHIVDNATQESLHTPPAVEELPERMQAMCDFANSKDSGDGRQPMSTNAFIHPVIKAITLHFMLAYDHPFCDGNGRTARALFYWMMARQGYWLMEFISISSIIKQAPAQYGKAFLYTETDGNDLTYFVIHQLKVIHQAVDALHAYVDEKTRGIDEAQRMLKSNACLSGKLNFRQLVQLRHALNHPRFSYVVLEHQRSHGVSYDVARKDLLQLSDELKLLDKTKRGKRYYFLSPADLEQRIGHR